MAIVTSDFGTTSTSNSNQFQSYSNSLFSPTNSDQQLTLRQAQLQQLQNQQMLLQKQSLSQDQASLLPPSESPTPNRYSPDNLTNNFPQTTPEKPGISQSPPSPADSGVVADSKSEGPNTSQELLQNLDQAKLDDGLSFMNNYKASIHGMSFEASTSVSSDQTSSNSLSFQGENNLNPSINSLGLSTSNSNFITEVGLGINSNDETENNITISPNLAAIWSTPAPTLASQDTPALATQTIDDIMLQALQQQQLSGWSNSSPNNPSAALTNPPPGLYNNALLQKQLQQQQQQNTAVQIQALQQQLALRRSQSTVATQPSLLSRSTSHQPGYMGGLSNLNQAKMNGLLPKTSPYSSWSNGQTSLSSGWPSANGGGRSTSLFNPLQQGSGTNRLLNGSAALRKQSLTSQMAPPPRLNRSISTPVKHSPYMNGLGLPTSLDDNPFFKMSDTSTQNGLFASENNDSIGFSNWESQLYDIMRSNENHSFGGHNLAGSSGKWGGLGGNVLFEETPFGQTGPNLANSMSPLLGDFNRDRFSRKVFVGGLPPDIDEEEIQASFRQFGPLAVDWPHKAESKSYFPPKGYAFLLFQEEISVQQLISCCLKDGDKLYLRVSSPTIREKLVQIRPWNLVDSDFVLDGSQPLDPRKTIFVGGVPRPLRAVELAMMMDRLYGGVCYAGIDVDPELKYPKGAGRVAFSNQQSYIAAISARFVQLQHGDIDKRVEVKPYVLDDQHCDECQGSRCGGKFAPFFCANVTCLQYYCENCWTTIHARPGREFHKPLVKEGADRTPRSMAYRW